MFSACKGISNVIARQPGAQDGVRAQEGARVQNDVASPASRTVAPKYQRRFCGVPMKDIVNSPFFFNSLKSHMLKRGHTNDDFHQLKTLLKRGEIEAFSPAKYGAGSPLDSKIKINLAGAGITQQEVTKVRKTFGMLQGVMELDLTNNEIMKLPDLRGMTSLRLLKVSENPLIRFNIDMLPPKAIVCLGGEKSTRTLLTGIMENMQTRYKDGNLPAILFGKELVEEEKGMRLPAPDGWRFQKVDVKRQCVDKGVCLDFAIVESENGEFFIVKPLTRPEASKAIGEIINEALGKWEAAFKQREDKPRLPTLPTIAVLCEEIRERHPKMSEHFSDLELKGTVGFRHEDYMAKNKGLAADFNAFKMVTDSVQKTLNNWANAFGQRSDNVKPPLLPDIIESLCEKIESMHSDLNQQLGSEFVKNHVSSYVGKKLSAFKTMDDFVKKTLNGMAVFKQAGHATDPSTPVIIEFVCKEITKRHPDINRELGNDYVKNYVANHVENLWRNPRNR